MQTLNSKHKLYELEIAFCVYGVHLLKNFSFVAGLARKHLKYLTHCRQNKTHSFLFILINAKESNFVQRLFPCSRVCACTCVNAESERERERAKELATATGYIARRRAHSTHTLEHCHSRVHAYVSIYVHLYLCLFRYRYIRAALRGSTALVLW